MRPATARRPGRHVADHTPTQGQTHPHTMETLVADTTDRTNLAIDFVSCDRIAAPSGVDGEAPPDPTRAPPRRRRARRLAEPLLFAALAAAVFAATEMTGASDPPSGGRAGQPRAASQPAGPGTSPRPVTARLVVPSTARAGERITIVGYRDSALCGPSEVRFDGTAIDHRITATATPYAHHVTEMFMAMTIPAAAAFGTHHIELYGPVKGGRAGPVCGDAPERHGRLASAEIILVLDAA
jgi:hypothetical protein